MPTTSSRRLILADINVTQLESDLDFSNLPYWDVVIIGAGPPGLAASLTTAHRALTMLVIEAKDRPSGQPQFLYVDKQSSISPVSPMPSVVRNCLSERNVRQLMPSCRLSFDEGDV